MLQFESRYLEKVEERDVTFPRTVLVHFVWEEKEVCDGSVDQVWVLTSDVYEVQSFSARVSSSPEQLFLFFLPGYFCVALH